MREDSSEPQLSKIGSANMAESSPGTDLHSLSMHGRVTEQRAIPRRSGITAVVLVRLLTVLRFPL